MKKIATLIVILYIIFAIFVTACLLSFNEYKVSVFGDKTLVIIQEDDDSIDYNKGDLVIVGKNGYKEADAGDTIFFYQNRSIKIAKIEQKRDYDDLGVTYEIEGDYQVVSDELIGTSKNEKVIPKLGGVLQLVESKWGFLFLIVFPSLIAFLHELYQLFLEIRGKSERN